MHADTAWTLHLRGNEGAFATVFLPPSFSFLTSTRLFLLTGRVQCFCHCALELFLTPSVASRVGDVHPPDLPLPPCFPPFFPFRYSSSPVGYNRSSKDVQPGRDLSRTRALLVDRGEHHFPPSFRLTSTNPPYRSPSPSRLYTSSTVAGPTRPSSISTFPSSLTPLATFLPQTRCSTPPGGFARPFCAPFSVPCQPPRCSNALARARLPLRSFR